MLQSTEGGLVEEIRRLLHHNPSVTVRQIPRPANKVAHRIAKFSLRDRDLSYWLESGAHDSCFVSRMIVFLYNIDLSL